MAKLLKFPKGFYWGASMSAHQVEGGNKNDWTVWEKENAKRLAEEAKRHWQMWQLELFPEALKPKNYISDRAADHYNRFEKDFDIAKTLHHNAHRFSIEWSRIEPEEGKFDEKEIEHYRKVIKALRERGIEPFVTLWHWTNPIWISDIGGWTNRKAPHYFSRYVAKVVNELGVDVKYWITINEPLVYASQSYIRGTWPPQRRNIWLYLRVIRHLIHGHRIASNAVRVIDGDAQIGITKANTYFVAYKNKSINRLLKKLADWWWNFYFLNSIKEHINFIGLNNYVRNQIRFAPSRDLLSIFNRNDNKEVSDMGWELYPEAMYHALKGLKRYKKPVIITENGLADAKDNKRAKYIRNVLRYVHKAIREGVDVRGYLHWSLLDNFEWDKGFWPRFGLAEIDYKNGLRRKVRGSAKEYAKIIRANAISLE